MAVNWNGRRFGELTTDEQREVTRAAGDQLSKELQANADAISAVLSRGKSDQDQEQR